ncbi:MAG: rhamnogalacturonan acetylesterase [Lentisphaeria bacterium]|nr:rhamnogalacturonan acetylesterase [Lentisphaeria bacterium]
MKAIFAAAALLFGGLVLNAADIYLAGDSTMCDWGAKYAPQQGWGHRLPEFCADGVNVVNFAQGGRSVKSFRADKGRWEALLGKLKEGDFVIIQFGINDSNKKDKSRYANHRSEFKELLTDCVREVREKNAVPVLATPIVRWAFKEDGKSLYNGTHGAYSSAMREVARTESVSLVDLNAIGQKELLAQGPEATRGFYMVSTGKKDNLHLTGDGAKAYAEWFVKSAKEQKLPLEKCFR